MMSNGQVSPPFHDHNGHVGLSYYSIETAGLLSFLTGLCRDSALDVDIRVLAREFQVRFFGELVELTELNRKVQLSFGEHSFSMRCDYYSGPRRCAKVTVECVITSNGKVLEVGNFTSVIEDAL